METDIPISIDHVLSEDVLLLIFSRLSWEDVFSVAQVCRNFNRVASSEFIWKRWFDLLGGIMQTQEYRYWFLQSCRHAWGCIKYAHADAIECNQRRIYAQFLRKNCLNPFFYTDPFFQWSALKTSTNFIDAFTITDEVAFTSFQINPAETLRSLRDIPFSKPVCCKDFVCKVLDLHNEEYTEMLLDFLEFVLYSDYCWWSTPAGYIEVDSRYPGVFPFHESLCGNEEIFQHAVKTKNRVTFANVFHVSFTANPDNLEAILELGDENFSNSVPDHIFNNAEIWARYLRSIFSQGKTPTRVIPDEIKKDKRVASEILHGTASLKLLIPTGLCKYTTLFDYSDQFCIKAARMNIENVMYIPHNLVIYDPKILMALTDPKNKFHLENFCRKWSLSEQVCVAVVRVECVDLDILECFNPGIICSPNPSVTILHRCNSKSDTEKIIRHSDCSSDLASLLAKKNLSWVLSSQTFIERLTWKKYLHCIVTSGHAWYTRVPSTIQKLYVKRIITLKSLSYIYLDERLKRNREVAIFAVIRNYKLYEVLPESLKNDDEIIYYVSKQNPNYIRMHVANVKDVISDAYERKYKQIRQEIKSFHIVC